MTDKATKAETAEQPQGETTVGMVKLTETVTLRVPITSPLDQREISVVTMRRPKVKDQMNHMVGDELGVKGMVGMMTDLIEGFSPQDMAEMDSADFNELRDILFGFLGISPASADETESSG